MATHKRVPEDLARVEELAKRWGKIVVQQHWGDGGPGLDVTLDQAKVVASLRARARERGLGSPVKDAPETDPCVVVSRAITYVTNNVGHMDYPRYRRLGLPATSAAVESPNKDVNYRVKGTGKFWNHPEGAEAILQVRAAMLSDEDRLENYLASRPGNPHRYTRQSERLETHAAA